MFFGNTIDLSLKGDRQKENFVWQYLVVRYIKTWFPHLLFDLLFIPAKMTGYLNMGGRIEKKNNCKTHKEFPFYFNKCL